jgi:hypothetical protein
MPPNDRGSYGGPRHHGRGGYGGPRRGPTASQIFAALQRSITSQDVRELAKQFNAARATEASYGGLRGTQLDPEANPNFPRRLVLWYGRGPYPGGAPDGAPLAPYGVFEEYRRGSLEALAFALEDANRTNPNVFHAIGFENVAEPLKIMLSS